MEGAHDVLVIGAGCAGMRAAIEAHDADSRGRTSLQGLSAAGEPPASAQSGVERSRRAVLDRAEAERPRWKPVTIRNWRPEQRTY